MLMAFSDKQLAQISRLAQPIPWARRTAYLERVIALLSGRQYGIKDVQRARGYTGAARAYRGAGYGMTRTPRSANPL
jgi:hypothetical protein